MESTAAQRSQDDKGVLMDFSNSFKQNTRGFKKKFKKPNLVKTSDKLLLENLTEDFNKDLEDANLIAVD